MMRVSLNLNFLNGLSVPGFRQNDGTPQGAIRKLRRVLDPNLTFEEHNNIFPLDLGPIWDLAAFSATKRHPNSNAFFTANFSEASSIEANNEWKGIANQFSAIFSRAFSSRCYASVSASEGTFVFQQSFVGANKAQRGVGFHVEAGDTLYAFKDYWQPPSSLYLIARDVEPVTLFMQGLDQVPWDLVTKQSEGGRLIFQDEALMRMGQDFGRLRAIPAGRVIAMTDRTIHSAQEAPYDRTQTFARAFGKIIPSKVDAPAF